MYLSRTSSRITYPSQRKRARDQLFCLRRHHRFGGVGARSLIVGRLCGASARPSRWIAAESRVWPLARLQRLASRRTRAFSGRGSRPQDDATGTHVTVLRFLRPAPSIRKGIGPGCVRVVSSALGRRNAHKTRPGKSGSALTVTQRPASFLVLDAEEPRSRPVLCRVGPPNRQVSVPASSRRLSSRRPGARHAFPPVSSDLPAPLRYDVGPKRGRENSGFHRCFFQIGHVRHVCSCRLPSRALPESFAGRSRPPTGGGARQ